MFTTLLPRASPSDSRGWRLIPDMMPTTSSGLEVAKAASVTPAMAGAIRHLRANPTVPRRKSSPPAPAQARPARSRAMFWIKGAPSLFEFSRRWY